MNDLQAAIPSAAFVFRGYNITNLGRSRELIEHRAYGTCVEGWLRRASQICSDQIGQAVDLVARVRSGQETDLESYPAAVALIVAMELAQIDLLKQFFGIEYTQAQLAYGYSLGEIAALSAGGMFDLAEALRIPLAMAHDCAELASDTTLGVLFSRGPALDVEAVNRLCLEINADGRGVIGVSAFLSPNSLLLFGQADTVDRFAARMRDVLPNKVHLRKNDSRWPPLHSPLMWQCSIPNRSAVLLHTLKVQSPAPRPPVFSLVTGSCKYSEATVRNILALWVDHPQRLWEAIYETLAQGVETMIHVGPEPNLIPATFTRLSDNVREQLAVRSLGGFSLRAVSRVVRRPWLAKLLPSRSALLRAPFVRQVILEDWLLEQLL